jgi:hypothetical protein
MMKKITFLLMLLSFIGYAQPTSAPSAPTENASDVISLFSNQFTSTATLSLANFTPAGNTATSVSAAGNDVYELVYGTGDFWGFNLSASIDLGSMENLHYDLWIEGTTQVGAVFNTTLSQHNGGHLTGQTAGYVDTNIINQGQEGMWLSFDIPLNETQFSGLTAAARKDIISQFVLSGTNLSNTGPIYVDNIYFWRTAVDPNTDASLSDLTVDATTVTGFAPTILTYNVELPNGTTVVPTVVGVATQAGNGSSNVTVTPAASIPGATTVLVTAPNGTDTETYTINFTEAVALPPAAPTPPSIPAISILSDVFTNIAVPQVDTFGGTLTNFDLNSDNNEEARSLINGSGFQFNWFPNSAFVDVSNAAFLHLDFYCDNLADGDILRIRLLDPDPGANGSNIARATFQAAQSGTWVSLDLEIPQGTNLNDFGDVDSASSPVDLTQLSLIQFNTLDGGSTLGSKEIFLSNIYFYGGTLSSKDVLSTKFKTYPNPTQDNWTIETQNVRISSITVYDVLGKSVMSMEPNEERAVIDGSGLKSGLYFAKVETTEGVSSLKLIKK